MIIVLARQVLFSGIYELSHVFIGGGDGRNGCGVLSLEIVFSFLMHPNLVKWAFSCHAIPH